MATELEVLRLVSDRLTSAGIPFMLTGSFALAYYATPRMTRDLDLITALDEAAIPRLVAAFARDFYIDEESVRDAVRSRQLFNLMHLESGIKVDLIIRKDSEFRQVEFARRQPVNLGGVETWIVSREDLILSKLAWAKDSGSELQRRDVVSLLESPVDVAYLRLWAPRLGVADELEQLLP